MVTVRKRANTLGLSIAVTREYIRATVTGAGVRTVIDLRRERPSGEDSALYLLQ
jgi:hypothetical protein